MTRALLLGLLMLTNCRPDLNACDERAARQSCTEGNTHWTTSECWSGEPKYGGGCPRFGRHAVCEYIGDPATISRTYDYRENPSPGNCVGPQHRWRSL